MALEHLRPAALLFAVDVYFPRSSLRDSTRLYRSTAARKIGGGYSSAIMRHADYGGATNAVHLVLMKGLHTPFTAPTTTLPRVLKHFVNTASRGRFWDIEPPPPSLAAAPRAPMVVDGIGPIDGLYDVCHPELEYAIPCMFKSSGWAQRWLTPQDWLALHDSPVSLSKSLEADKAARSSIALALSPLLAGWIIRTCWGSIGGGEAGEAAVPQATVLASDDERSKTSRQREECSRDVVSLQDRPEAARAVNAVDDIHIIIRDQHDLAKAVKADDADVPVYLWDNRIMRREALT